MIVASDDKAARSTLASLHDMIQNAQMTANDLKVHGYASAGMRGRVYSPVDILVYPAHHARQLVTRHCHLKTASLELITWIDAQLQFGPRFRTGLSKSDNKWDSRTTHTHTAARRIRHYRHTRLILAGPIKHLQGLSAIKSDVLNARGDCVYAKFSGGTLSIERKLVKSILAASDERKPPSAFDESRGVQLGPDSPAVDFSQLPGEIRDAIYRFAVTADECYKTGMFRPAGKNTVCRAVQTGFDSERGYEHSALDPTA